LRKTDKESFGVQPWMGFPVQKAKRGWKSLDLREGWGEGGSEGIKRVEWGWQTTHRQRGELGNPRVKGKDRGKNNQEWTIRRERGHGPPLRKSLCQKRTQKESNHISVRGDEDQKGDKNKKR